MRVGMETCAALRILSLALLSVGALHEQAHAELVKGALAGERPRVIVATDIGGSDPDDEINPFMHITIHQIVETQIRTEKPPEVERVFQGLKDKGQDRHDAIHAIGAIFVEYLFDVLKNGNEFDQEKYVADIKQLLKDA